MKLNLKILLFILVGFLVYATLSYSQPTNYTATMVMSNMEMPYACDGKKIRTEMNMGSGEQGMGMGKMITISRTDLKKSYMIYPEKKMYMESDWQNRKKTPSIYDQDPDYKIDKVKVGSETIDKHPCIKYTVTITNTKTNEKFTGTAWEATDLQNLPIKWEMVTDKGQKSAMELKNVKLNAATADMFEIPAGYKKAENMMEIMGMPGGMGEGMRMPRRKAPNTEE